jgi:methionine synthase II (cobalamin-independent)
MFKPFLTTGIGSLPYENAMEACRLILKVFDIPFWPQLPRLSFNEFMIPQYSEGMPFVRIDSERRAVWIEKNGSDELDRFYENWTEKSRIAISEDYAAGLHTFLKIIKTRRFASIKGQITGPLTFTLGLKDRDGRAIYFDEELRQIALMLLQAKLRWQIDLLKQYADTVVIFVDEPILSALGTSGYVGVSNEEALRLLQEIVEAISLSGGITGIHCCGNADWPLVIRSGTDIISFDAYDYIDTVAIYCEEISHFFDRGGILAWGIVPTTESVRNENPESMKSRFDKSLAKLTDSIPSSAVYNNILITPSCGTGSLTIDEAVKVFQLVMALKEEYS